jgi:hypothetical protein
MDFLSQWFRGFGSISLLALLASEFGCSGPDLSKSAKKPTGTASGTPGPVNSADIGGIPKVSVVNGDAKSDDSAFNSEKNSPKAVGTLAGLAIKPDITITAAPIAAELLNPTLPTAKSPMLKGEWVGLCFASGGANGTKCDRKRVFVNENRTCPTDYIFKEYGIRTLADDSLWASTCIFNGTPSSDQLLNPKKYALAGALYGFCRSQKYVPNSPCEDTVWPMKEDRSCPEGFQFVRTAGDGPRGTMNPTYLETGACVLSNDSARPAPIFPGTLSSLCVHWHDRDDCAHGKFGPIIANKNSCSGGFQVSHFSARWNNDNRFWASICIKD